MERKPIGNSAFAPPPVRTIGIGEKLPPPRRPPSNEGSESESGEEEETAKNGRLTDLLPDSSHSSRRPPLPGKPAFAHARVHVTAHSGVIAVAGSFVVVAHHHIKVFDLNRSESPLHNIDLKDAGFDWRGKDPRVTCMEFRPADVGAEADRGRFVWLGTKDGTIWELDAQTGGVTTLRFGAHSAPVTHLFRHSRSMASLDEHGKVLVFAPASEPDAGGCATMLAHGTPRVMRIADKQNFAKILGGLLWTSGGPGSAGAHTNGTASARGPVVRVCDVMAQTTTSGVKSLLPLENVGAVTSGAVLQSHPDKVYLGHEGGFITVWDLKTEDGTPACVEVVKVSASDVLCLEGVGDRLWAGGRKGMISAFDVEHRPWVVTNNWMAHSGLPVQKLFVDPYSIEKCGQLSVISVGRDETARFWDGLLGVDWIDNELLQREPSFSSFRPLNVLLVSWNVDAAKPDALTGCVENTNFLDSVLGSVDSPDIIAFGFQELIDLESRKMAAKTVLLGGKKKAADGSISEKVSRSYKMWHDRLILAVRLAMPPDCPYTVVHAENLVGLFTCIFIKSSERKGLNDVSITTVKRGIGGMYGNKGGIVARLVIDDSSICFINCHLAAGQHHVRARNADVAAVLEEKEVFPRSGCNGDYIAYVGGGDGSMVLDHEIVFLNGDLNYRIEQRRDAAISAISAGQFEHLLTHDQLLKEMRFNRGFRLRSFVEAPITFAPTYKYDRRSGEYDSSEKRRVPAWCDRILYRARDPARVASLHYRRYEANVSDHRPVSAGFRVTVKAVDAAARARARVDVERLWGEQQRVLLENTHLFFVAQEAV
ncbi:DNase I-like protein [Phellopilus nigrolimitatus]|nr:DNase I-like protein [Phellopilus nigrolimitatus]